MKKKKVKVRYYWQSANDYIKEVSAKEASKEAEKIKKIYGG